MFGKAFPGYGLYARHISGFKTRDVKIDLTAPAARPAIHCEDAEDLEFLDWQLPFNVKKKRPVYFDSVHKTMFGGSLSPWQINGQGNSDINIPKD